MVLPVTVPSTPPPNQSALCVMPTADPATGLDEQFMTLEGHCWSWLNKEQLGKVSFASQPSKTFLVPLIAFKDLGEYRAFLHGTFCRAGCWLHLTVSVEELSKETPTAYNAKLLRRMY